MMERELGSAASHRRTRLSRKLRDKQYRDSYVSAHTKTFLANQFAAFQGDMSQKEFGELIGKPQPNISRLQNPNYGRHTLTNLLDIASRLDVAFFARFVDYPTFLKLTSDFSDEALRPSAFNPEQLDLLDFISKPVGLEIVPAAIIHPGISSSHPMAALGIQSSHQQYGEFGAQHV